MKRRNLLAGSWYPESETEVSELLGRWTDDIKVYDEKYAAIVPHAGWFYSGRIAARVLKQLCYKKELLIIIGGHLHPGSSILAAYEEEIELPLKSVKNRIELLDKLRKEIRIKEDVYQDNTVEVVAAMISYFSPEAEILWLRAPADSQSVSLAEAVFKLMTTENINAAVIGSTDLTHYGSNYSFKPKGSGKDALQWVKEVNDAELINMLLEFDYKNAIEHAIKKKSACSIGAAIAAARFAELNGAERGILEEYATSYDITPAESFVGYAGILY